AKAGFEPRYGLGVSDEAAPAQAIVPLASIVGLTGSANAGALWGEAGAGRRSSIVDLAGWATAGRLKWKAPARRWTVVRFGYTPTGKTNHPSPDSGRGLECDKLSRAGLDQHWNGIMTPILADLGELAPKALKSALVDSYDVGL